MLGDCVICWGEGDSRVLLFFLLLEVMVHFEPFPLRRGSVEESGLEVHKRNELMFRFVYRDGLDVVLCCW